jgi:hypothetical protein
LVEAHRDALARGGLVRNLEAALSGWHEHGAGYFAGVGVADLDEAVEDWQQSGEGGEEAARVLALVVLMVSAAQWVGGEEVAGLIPWVTPHWDGREPVSLVVCEQSLVAVAPIETLAVVGVPEQYMFSVRWVLAREAVDTLRALARVRIARRVSLGVGGEELALDLWSRDALALVEEWGGE